MASEMVRRGGRGGRRHAGSLARTTQEIDPFERMRQLLAWDPFREWPARMPPTSGEEALGFVPAFEVRETHDGYVFKADLPGVPEADLDINLSGNRLTVSGRREAEREEEAEDELYFYERSYGSFSRSFTLPDDADTDRVEAKLENGVLTLTIPKRSETLSRRIPIGAGAAEGQEPAEAPHEEEQPTGSGGGPREGEEQRGEGQQRAQERPEAHV